MDSKMVVVSMNYKPWWGQNIAAAKVLENMSQREAGTQKMGQLNPGLLMGCYNYYSQGVDYNHRSV